MRAGGRGPRAGGRGGVEQPEGGVGSEGGHTSSLKVYNETLLKLCIKTMQWRYEFS